MWIIIYLVIGFVVSTYIMRQEAAELPEDDFLAGLQWFVGILFWPWLLLIVLLTWMGNLLKG